MQGFCRLSPGILLVAAEQVAGIYFFFYIIKAWIVAVGDKVLSCAGESGVISISNLEESSLRLIEKYGKPEHVEEVFEKHRLDKVMRTTDESYTESINDDLFILGQEIKIPRCIRNYYKGIDDLDLEAQKAFRNAARLYNKSTILGMNESSFQISLLVASMETLGKCEGIKYSQFMKKYNPDALKKEIDDMYEIRS